MTLATAPRRPTAPAADRATRPRRDLGAWFLVLPALLPILVLSVGPLLYGIGLAFTDAQSGRTQATRFVGLLNFSDLFQDSLFWDSFRSACYGPSASPSRSSFSPSAWPCCSISICGCAGWPGRSRSSRGRCPRSSSASCGGWSTTPTPAS